MHKISIPRCSAEITSLCSTVNVELVKSLGADRIIDENKEDFTQYGQAHDVIFDVLGKSSFSGGRNPKGFLRWRNYRIKQPILPAKHYVRE